MKCDFCEAPFDRGDGKRYICEECKQKLPKEFWPTDTPVSVVDFWTCTPKEQRTIQAKTRKPK